MKILFLSAALASSLLAAEKLEAITVTTATKTQKSIEGIAASVEVITEEEIEKMGAQTLMDIFKKTPGLILQYGTFPSAGSKSKSSVSFRGIGANGTLFLLDGRRLAGEVKNPYDLDRIPASMIERIEIIKGPMSALYGADAVGGIINIITKKPTSKTQGSAGLRAGANREGDAKSYNANVDLRGKRDRLGYSFYANALTTNPYTERETADVYAKTQTGKTKPSAHPHPQLRANLKDFYGVDETWREDSDIYTLGSRLEYEVTQSTVAGFDINYLDEEREGIYIGNFHPTNYEQNGTKIPAYNVPVRSRDDNRRLDMGADLKTLATDDLTLNFRIYRSNYEKRNVTTALYYADMGYASEENSSASGMDANVDITSYEAYVNYILNEYHLLTFGGEYRDEKREGTVFNQAGTFEERSVDYKAVYLQDEWEIADTLSATLGARYDAISNADDKATFKVGIVKNFSELLSARANFAQGYRVPDIRELYIRKRTPAGYWLGADTSDATVGKEPYDLKPEFANSYEIGLGGKNGGFHYDLALFYNDIEDKIEEVFIPNANPSLAYYTFKNVSEAKTQGVEASVGYLFGNKLAADLRWFELDTEDKETGKDLEFNPDRVVSLKLDYEIFKNLNAGAIATYTGKQYYTESVGGIKIGRKTHDYTLVDLTASWRFGPNGAYEVYGGIDNIFDEEVDEVLGSNVGPFFYAGMRYNF